jgi:hypothetical protein
MTLTFAPNLTDTYNSRLMSKNGATSATMSKICASLNPEAHRGRRVVCDLATGESDLSREGQRCGTARHQLTIQTDYWRSLRRRGASDDRRLKVYMVSQ